MHRKLHYISKCNKLVQLVVQVQYDVNVIYGLRGRDTHAHAHRFRGQKQFQETKHAPAKEHVPGLIIEVCINIDSVCK